MCIRDRSYTVHCRLPNPGRRCALWVQDENGWSQADFEIDGQYLLLTSQTEEITFCVTERPSSLFVWIAAGIGCLLFLAAAFYVLPVSYTHLDVYKRQALIVPKGDYASEKALLDRLETYDQVDYAMGPVSYTHLGVYKRQAVACVNKAAEG